MKEALQEIVDFLQRECGEDDMASVKINSSGDVYLSVGVCRDDPRRSLDEFAALIDAPEQSVGVV
jgi:hypothetical protein